mmetsp:Transcript_9444/g.14495  ORF Transcript_9444/g.14495 Transcript_9444/m.14495 type:complete len:96 (-) Transcript_9444:1060-1347(-)
MEFNYITSEQTEYDGEYYEENEESGTKQLITLNYNEYVRQIDLWKHRNVLEKITIFIGNKLNQGNTQIQDRSISAGEVKRGELFSIKVPQMINTY